MAEHHLPGDNQPHAAAAAVPIEAGQPADAQVNPFNQELADLVAQALNINDARNFERFGAMLAHQGPNLMGMPKLARRSYLDYIDFRKRMRAYLTLTNIHGERASIIILHALEGDAFAVLRENYDSLALLDPESLWERLDAEFSVGEGAVDSVPALINTSQGQQEKIDDYAIRFQRSFSAAVPKPPAACTGETVEDCKRQFEQLRAQYVAATSALEVGLFVRSLKPDLRVAAAAATPFEFSAIVRILRRTESLSNAAFSQPKQYAPRDIAPLFRPPGLRRPFNYRGQTRPRMAFTPRGHQMRPPYAAQGYQGQQQFGPHDGLNAGPRGPAPPLPNRGMAAQQGRNLRPRCPTCNGAAHPGRPCPAAFAVSCDDTPWGGIFNEIEDNSDSTSSNTRAECHAIFHTWAPTNSADNRGNAKWFLVVMLFALINAANGDKQVFKQDQDHILFKPLAWEKSHYPLKMCGDETRGQLYRLDDDCARCAEHKMAYYPAGTSLLTAEQHSLHYLAIVRSEQAVPVQAKACWCKRRQTTCQFTESFFGAKTSSCTDTALEITIEQCRIMCQDNKSPDGVMRPLNTKHYATEGKVTEQYTWLGTNTASATQSECIHTTVTAPKPDATIRSGVVTRKCRFSDGECTTVPTGRLVWPVDLQQINSSCEYLPVTEVRCLELKKNQKGQRVLRCTDMDFVITRTFPKYTLPCPGFDIHETAQGAHIQLFSLSVHEGKLEVRHAAEKKQLSDIRARHWSNLANIEMLHEAQLQRLSDDVFGITQDMECRVREMQCKMESRLGSVIQALELVLPDTALLALHANTPMVLEGDLARATTCFNVTQYEFLNPHGCYRQPAVKYRLNDAVHKGFIGPGKIIMTAGTPCRRSRPQYISFGKETFEIRSRTIYTDKTPSISLVPAFTKADPPVFHAHPNETISDSYLTGVELVVEESILDKPTQATETGADLRASSRSKIPGYLNDMANVLSEPLATFKRQLVLIVSIAVSAALLFVAWKCCPRPKCRRRNRFDTISHAAHRPTPSAPPAVVVMQSPATPQQPLAQRAAGSPSSSTIYPHLQQRLRTVSTRESQRV